VPPSSTLPGFSETAGTQVKYSLGLVGLGTDSGAAIGSGRSYTDRRQRKKLSRSGMPERLFLVVAIGVPSNRVSATLER